MPIFVVAIIFIAFSSQAKDWQLQLSERGVDIYTQSMDNPPFQKFRAEIQVEATRGAFLTLLLHTEANPDWVEHAEGADVIIFQPPNRHLVHTRFSPPWPVNKRDLVTASRYWQEPDSGVLYLAAESRPNAFPTQEGYLRMLDAEACWQISPLEGNTIKVRYEGFTNPSGNMPYFLTNKVGIQALFNTFTKLKRQLKRNEYRFANPEVPKRREFQSKPCNALLAEETAVTRATARHQ
ncbi:START domain-containing protein [Corallincola spongiicola]|uniref:START domain-containing protein n=1 Tax=Corallincola spongiicola TaxID=2520508 RepID=A0ABY1WRX9_9GAMM|nr:START domain-containing protein [Corallincola spongiicola]TAA47496.1 hypothetical protein EXY25_09750 [Corallincola spongiicola]